MSKWIFIVVCCVILAGCATTRRPDSQEELSLQGRIELLEKDMEEKESEIGSIKNELRQVKDARDSSFGRMESSPSSVSRSVDSGSKTVNSEKKGTIRVDGVTVTKVQTALKNAGFYQGAVDGKLGPKTMEAIKEFQKSSNLTVDGVVGSGTWSKLKSNL
ncbi:MAG: peptidoglycan-binding protein [Candidatus Omnitrophica bacterium]|nr:peptidoglycan-binding protein [Candidatus Omnitrophota bacterium]